MIAEQQLGLAEAQLLGYGRHRAGETRQAGAVPFPAGQCIDPAGVHRPVIGRRGEVAQSREPIIAHRIQHPGHGIRAPVREHHPRPCAAPQ